LRAAVHALRHDPESVEEEALLLEVVTRLRTGQAGRAGERDVPNPGLTSLQLRRAGEFMHAHLDEDIGLADMARVVGRSPFHFAHSFRATTGQSPYQYLIQLRIDHAKALLAETRIPLVEVGLAAGYSTAPHFSTAFKQIVGVTPSEYRKLATNCATRLGC
jgi:transcriptional regulator GlxA family with amidase domain